MKQGFARLLHLPALPLIAGPLVLFAPLLLAGRAIYWGTPFSQFVPWRTLAVSLLRSGQLPLWNPLSGMGAPLLANHQSALFYPPNWLLLALNWVGGPGWDAWGQALVITLHLAWAGLGMARLARRVGLEDLGQAVSGLAFGMSGYLVGRAGFLSFLTALAWVPWVLLYTPGPGKFVPGLSSLIKLTLALALQLLAGHAQTAWYTGLLAGLWALYGGWQIRGQSGFLPRIGRSWAFLALGAAWAAGLAAVQMLPTGEYLLQSQRAGAVDFEYAMTYSFWPWRLLTLFAPRLFGSPVSGNYWGYGNFWEDHLYIGLLPLLLALGALLEALIAGLRRRSQDSVQASSSTRGLVRFLGTLILVSLALALGKNIPLFPWLYRHAPTFAMFQAPTRWSLWAEFSLALLAGIGVEKLTRPAGRRLYWTRLAAAGAFAVSLGAGLAWLLLGSVSPTVIQATALAGVWGLGGIILMLTAPPARNLPAGGPTHTTQMERRPGRAQAVGWNWALVGFVLLDLLAAGWGLNPSNSMTLYYQPAQNAAQVRDLLQDGRLYLSETDEYDLKFERFMRFDTFETAGTVRDLRAALLPNANLLDNLPSANNFDPLVPGRFARWMDVLQTAPSSLQVDLLNRMGVRVVEKIDSSSEYGVQFEAFTNPLPRLQWASCAILAGSEKEARERLLQVAAETNAVVIEGLPAGSKEACIPVSGAIREAAEVALQVIAANRIEASVQASTDGWLVLRDTWYPGWQVQVDGQPARLYPADALFKSLPLTRGSHTVIFVYRPVSFYLGILISILAAAGLIAAWRSKKWRHNRQ